MSLIAEKASCWKQIEMIQLDVAPTLLYLSRSFVNQVNTQLWTRCYSWMPDGNECKFTFLCRSHKIAIHNIVNFGLYISNIPKEKFIDDKLSPNISTLRLKKSKIGNPWPRLFKKLSISVLDTKSNDNSIDSLTSSTI